MIEMLIYLVVWLLALIIVFAIIKLAAAQFGIPAEWIKVVGYILGLVFLVVILNAFGVMPRGLRP